MAKLVHPLEVAPVLDVRLVTLIDLDLFKETLNFISSHYLVHDAIEPKENLLEMKSVHEGGDLLLFSRALAQDFREQALLRLIAALLRP